MRLDNSARNGIYGVVRTVTQLIFKFIVRTIIIKVLGEQFLGLDSLFSSILQVLSLAELGFGSAIVYSMYEPMAKGNYEKIGALLGLYRKFYYIIAGIILLVGVGITPFLGYLIKGSAPDGINIYALFSIFLLNTVVGYFFSYKRSLLYASQRNDIESKVATVIIFLMNTSQIVLLLVFKNYYIYVITMPAFTVLENFIISYLVSKKYSHIDMKNKLSKPDSANLKKYMYAMIVHKIGSVAVFSTDNIIMSSFLGLSIVGLYNNYYLLIAAILSFTAIFVRAIGASVGESVAVESVEKNYKNFKNLTFLNFWIAGFCSICFLALFQTFITVWLGERYLLDFAVVIAIVVSFYVNQTRAIVGIYRETTGTFYNDRFKPLLETGVNLVLSLVLVQYIGIFGVILGTIISSLFVAIPIEAYVVFKNYFKRPLIKYFIVYIIYTLIVGVSAVITYYTCALIPLTGWLKLIIDLLVCIVVPNLLFVSISFRTDSFKYLIGVVKYFLRKILRRSKQSVER